MRNFLEALATIALALLFGAACFIIAEMFR